MFKTLPSKIPLGRWERTTHVKNNLKIDMANIDHCGTCSFLEIKEVEKEKKLSKKLVNPAH